MARPRGRKNSPPVIADAALAQTFVKKNAQGEFRMTPLAQAERNYLLPLFRAFRDAMSPTIAEKAPNVTNSFRYTPRQLFDNIMIYMETALAAGQPLTIGAICLFCQIDRRDMIPVNLAKLPKEYSFLNDCIRFIETYMEFTAQKKQNPAFQIFWLKNRGWVDKIEIEASSTQGALTDDERQAAQQRVAKFSEAKLVEYKTLPEGTPSPIPYGNTQK